MDLKDLKIISNLIHTYGIDNVYTSSKNPIICAESDMGKAYVLGKKSGIQSTF